MRARGFESSFPDRSISAEVELEPGRYEVLPKISATRDMEKPFVEDVVKKAAEDNPQKLRQIGLNYDIAHAKGGFQEEEEAKKKEKEAKLRKEKEDKDKKEKEEKEKKETEEKEKKATKLVDSQQKEGVSEQKDVDKTKDEEKTEAKSDDKPAPKEEDKDGSSIPSTELPKSADVAVDDGKKTGTGGEKETEKAEEKTEEPKDKSGTEDKEDTNVASAAPEEPAKDQSEESPNPWNAVVVVGLRVYSKDSELMVALVKPKDPEEASVLDVDGVSGAGATM